MANEYKLIKRILQIEEDEMICAPNLIIFKYKIKSMELITSTFFKCKVFKLK